MAATKIVSDVVRASDPRAHAEPAEQVLRQTLMAGANPGGGWGYYAGKASRLEPTSWALVALSQEPAHIDLSGHRAFLAHAQRSSGWLIEDTTWPVNIGFNAIVAFTLLTIPSFGEENTRRRLLTVLLGSRGVEAPRTQFSSQDNRLQGWSWIDSTFSWVEPTAWALLALKKARRAGVIDAVAHARIDEAERLLVDRCCRIGGWNYGNASMLQQDLRPHVPTSALGLLALQDRRDLPAVVRSLAYLEHQWREEQSAIALALSLIALDTFGRPIDEIESRLREHAAAASAFGNLHGIALALLALSNETRGHAFRL